MFGSDAEQIVSSFKEEKEGDDHEAFDENKQESPKNFLGIKMKAGVTYVNIFYIFLLKLTFFTCFNAKNGLE